jgi:hypothetical protein
MTEQGVAGREQVLGSGDDASSDEEGGPADADPAATMLEQLVDAAVAEAEQRQQTGRPVRARRSQRNQGLDLEDYVLDSTMQEDQQRVAQVRGESAAAAPTGERTAPTGKQPAIKRKRVAM